MMHQWRLKFCTIVVLGRATLTGGIPREKRRPSFPRRERRSRSKIRLGVTLALECMICHNQRGLFGIGFTTPQLNRTNSDGLAQLEQWLKKKIVVDSRNLKARRAVKLADPYDPKSGTLEERVRAYLHVNCAHCHYPLGWAAAPRCTWSTMFP